MSASDTGSPARIFWSVGFVSKCRFELGLDDLLIGLHVDGLQVRRAAIDV